MKRLTVDTTLIFCDIAQCSSIPGGSFCEDGYCDQRRCYERLREYERTGLMPEDVVNIKIERDAAVAYMNHMEGLDGEILSVDGWNLNGDLEPLETILNDARECYNEVMEGKNNDR